MFFQSSVVACSVSALAALVISCGSDGAETAKVSIHESPRPACARLFGSDRDPCERRSHMIDGSDSSAVGYGIQPPPLPLDPEWLYRLEWSRQGVNTPQVVVRGIVAPNSTRCIEVNAYHFRDGSSGVMEAESGRTSEVCYVDVEVSEYIVGVGPLRISIVAAWNNGVDRTIANYGTPTYFAEVADPVRESMEGYEYVFELSTPPDLAWGDWTPSHYWDIQRRDDGSVVGRSGLWLYSGGTDNVGDWEYPIDELQRKLKAAHAKVAAEYGGRISDEPDSPMLVTDASRASLLAQLRELGAYDAPGITPVPAPPARDSGWSLWR